VSHGVESTFEWIFFNRRAWGLHDQWGLHDLGSEHFNPVFKDQECVLEFGRRASVARHGRPIVVPHLHVHSPCQHGLCIRQNKRNSLMIN